MEMQPLGASAMGASAMGTSAMHEEPAELKEVEPENPDKNLKRLIGLSWLASSSLHLFSSHTPPK